MKSRFSCWWLMILLMMTGGMSFALAQMPMGPGSGQPKEEEYPHPELITELPPIKEPMVWWMVVLLILGGLVLVGLLLWVLFKERAPRPVKKPEALRTALAKMEKLKAEMDELEPGEVAHRVSMILREFQELKYEVPAPYRTSEELYGEGAKQTSLEVRSRFGPLAEVHDRLAFAPQLSAREDVKELVESAIVALEAKVPPPVPVLTES
ncbi:hypothetical protein FEM03_05110 [Phragmitibacter flavus]|uniref:DUF4381 domain-containing protein n=1 Tax=Phragmitibacter flavus TaxID=2576071 RepID=A0A5R8KIG5_9BACT|nr:hypothetical protein [Phragmitibacter flavus]TLD72108.1 hypothetical protein FEM03_05110 [Phragmitibacter flavus]